MEENDVVEVYPVHGTGEKRHGWFVNFYNQWPAVLRPSSHNWHDWALTVFKVAGENSPYKSSWEVELGLLGFNLTITYVFRDTDEPMDEDPSHSAGEQREG